MLCFEFPFFSRLSAALGSLPSYLKNLLGLPLFFAIRVEKVQESTKAGSNCGVRWGRCITRWVSFYFREV